MSKAHATLHPPSDQMPTRLRLTHLSEFSAHDQGLTLVLDTAILLHAAQVHAATRNDPSTSRNACQHALDQNILFRRVDRQLSWNHRQAIGWKQMKVPRKAPISATRSWKLGTALAMMYASMVTDEEQLYQMMRSRRFCAGVGGFETLRTIGVVESGELAPLRDSVVMAVTRW